MKRKHSRFVLALIAFSMLTSCGGNTFSSNALKKIELGSTKEEVERKLGKPHETSTSFGEKWYYFQDSFKSKYDKVKYLLENGDSEADFIKADKLYSEMEKMTYKFTMVKFDGNKSVSEVFYDSKHKYEESNDYATNEKIVSKVSLSISDIQYYVMNTDEDSSMKLINTNNKLSYEATFSDGSYIHSYAGGSKTTIEGNFATVTWKDDLSEYKVTKKANRIGTLDSEGNFTLEYSKGDIVLPDCISEITDEMFLNNTELTSIVLPNSIKKIGRNAFKGCTSLKSITIPSSVNTIGEYAFAGCRLLTSIEIPNSVTEIGDGMFYECSSLTSIRIPKAVTSIGNNVFEKCAKLTAVTIDKDSDLEKLGKNVFKDTKVKFNSLNEANYLSCGDNQKFALISINKDFKQNVINISDKTVVIADDAFDNSNVDIFFEKYEMNCKKIDSGYKLLSCGNENIKKIEIPNLVTSISYAALENCISLESITIPFVGENLDGTGDSKFEYIFGEDQVPSTLKEVFISGGNKIGNYAFAYCSLLVSIVIPNSVTSIGDYAFQGCRSIASIFIPNSVISIGEDAFRTSSNDSKYGENLFIYCEASNKPSGWHSNWCRDSAHVYWGYGIGLGNLLIEDEIVYIIDNGSAVVSGLSNVKTTINIPCQITLNEKVYSVKSLGDYSLSGVGRSAITSVTLGTSIVSIGNYAFSGCSALESIEIPNSVTSIGDFAFYYCSSLTSVFIPNSVTSIGDYAFYYCSSLTSIFIPNSVTSIGEFSFYGCVNLIIYCEEISQPSTWKDSWSWSRNEHEEWQYQIYWGITQENIIYQDGLQFLIVDGNAVVTGYTKEMTNTISIPSTITFNGNIYSVTSIGNKAFSKYSSLTSIDIPNSVTSIGDYAFQGCSSITSIFIPNSVTSIGNHAFEGCYGLDSIFIPNSVSNIGDGAFYHCYSLTIYCENTSRPSGWSSYWNSLTNGFSNARVYWGITQENIIYQDGLQFLIVDGNAVVTGYTKEITNTINIPSTITFNGNIYSVTSIGKGAFSYCKSTSINIPDSVTSIGTFAFYGCKSLTSIVIPNSVQFIGSYAFDQDMLTNSLTIFCEASSKPSGWDNSWNCWDYGKRIPVYWSGQWSYVDGVPTIKNS